MTSAPFHLVVVEVPPKAFFQNIALQIQGLFGGVGEEEGPGHSQGEQSGQFWEKSVVKGLETLFGVVRDDLEAVVGGFSGNGVFSQQQLVDGTHSELF